jgi:hypothetical protein
MMVDVLCQELPLIETGCSSPKPRKPPVAAATTHFPLVSRTSPQHIAPEAVFVFLVMLKYVEICWNMLRLWLCVSVIFCLAFLTVFCFMFSPHQSSALGGEEKMFSVRRSKACPALRSGRISHHAGPWIQFALYQLQWTHESEFGFAWQAHGAWGAWGAGYGVQGPFCLNSEGVGTILNAANMLQLVFSDALHSRSMDEVTRSPACYSVSPGVF